MDDVIRQVRNALEGNPNVRMAYVFGSTVAGAPRVGSDVDVAVHWATRPTLEELGRVVDEIQSATRRQVDLVDLATAPPLLMREILTAGRLVVARDDTERLQFETHALARFMDTAHLRRVQATYLHEWAERYRAGQR